MKAFGLFVGALLLCSSPASAQAPDYDLFKNFVAMKLPQRSVPVGAKWVPGIGPTGSGAAADNISAISSAATLNIDKTLKRNVAFSLGTFFGLDANRARTLDADLANITIVRVTDLTRLDSVVAGDQLLYLAVKAGTITIKTDSTTAANLKAAAEVKDIPASVTLGAGNTAKVEMNGSDLFIAYQVMSLGQPAISQKIVKHDGNELTIDGTYRFRFCQCAPGSKLQIEWQNLRNVGLGGQIETHRIEHHPVANRLSEYPLDSYFAGSQITAARVLFSYEAKQECVTGIDPENKPFRMCGPIRFPAAQNKITLTKTSFRIAPVAKPVGPF
jgi:hypothetical protein